VKTLTAALALLVASVVAAQGEDRKCIERFNGWLDGDKPMTMTVKKRLCDPKNFVSDPNEYGWACDWDIHAVARVKGHGAKQKRDAFCATE
jgi:hypothetical protein